MKLSLLSSTAFALLALPAFSQSVSVVQELSRRTGMSVQELRGYLSHCEMTQLSMNICAFRDVVAADLQMQSLLQQMSLRRDQGGRTTLAKEQQNWLLQAKAKCNAAVDREVRQFGSMRPMVYGQCMSAATQKRITQLRQAPGG
jgi:uncharacterized protein YecT (DUF1311 family)